MVVTIATVIKNVRLSRRQKADLVSFRRCIHTLGRLTHFVALKPDQTPSVQSIHNLSRTKAGFQNVVTTKTYVKTGCMSTQQKAEFIGNIFCIRSFLGGHGEILPKSWFIPEGAICPEMLIQQPVERPSESWESCLPKWYLGLPEFQQIRD
jgi:hypothetical protein